MRHPQFNGIILPCRHLRQAFLMPAMKVALATQELYPDVITDEVFDKTFVDDPYGPCAKLEALVYANAITEAIGSTVVLRMMIHHKHCGQLVYNLQPSSLYVEQLVADRLKPLGIEFLSQSGFMHYNNLYSEFLCLSLLFRDDVLISNYEN